MISRYDFNRMFTYLGVFEDVFLLVFGSVGISRGWGNVRVLYGLVTLFGWVVGCFSYECEVF